MIKMKDVIILEKAIEKKIFGKRKDKQNWDSKDCKNVESNWFLWQIYISNK